MITIKHRLTGKVLLELDRSDLSRADLTSANLTGANLRGANLTGADLIDATLRYADLTGATLRYANLTGADLSHATLTGADLSHATLTGANLYGADLTGATLRYATMPDGRTWEAYRQDHLAGLCQTPEVRAKAIEAWGKHTWKDCPMHAALGIDRPEGPKALEIAAWVALYDSRLLERPSTEAGQ